MAEKTKQTQKSNKKVCWTVEEEELLVELWPNYECLYKTNSPEFKRAWTNGNPPVKISGEDLKQSLKAHSLVKNIKI